MDAANPWWSPQKAPGFGCCGQPRSHFRSHLISLLLHLAEALLKQTAKGERSKRWCQSDPLPLLVCFFRNWWFYSYFLSTQCDKPKITDQNIGLSKANKSHMFLLWHKHKVEWSMHPSSALGSFEPHPVGCPPTKAPAADAPFASRASPPYLPIRPPFCSSSCWRVHGITQPIDHQTIPQENHHFLVGGINCINLPFPGKWVVYEIVLPIYFEKGLQELDPIRQIL